MNVSGDTRWWYELLRKAKKSFFADSKFDAVLSHWFRRVGYPRAVSIFYMPLTLNRLKIWRPLKKQSDWSSSNDAERHYFDECDTFSGAYRPMPLYCSVVNKVTLMGSSNFVLAQDSLIHHDLYAFETDFTSEENYFRLVIARDFGRAIWMMPINPGQRFKAAAVFTDGCAANYAHWLTEVLPRIASFCEDERFKDIPVVVDKGLHANIQASLRLVIGEHRVVHEVAAGESVYVERLYWMSAVGYVPYERRAPSVSGHGQGVFSPYALGLTRAICLKAVDASQSINTAVSGSKIYLKRNSQVRRLLNAEELEIYLKSQGFELVEPEKLSFLEQVKLFSQASCIVGPTGAAFANLIFAPSGSRIVVLMGKHPDASYDYWNNIAKAVGLQVECLLGDMIDLGRGIHSDFSIDIAALDGALRGH